VTNPLTTSLTKRLTYPLTAPLGSKEGQGASTPVVSGLLDGITQPYQAVSGFRKLRASYTGFSCTLQRDSDNTTQDFAQDVLWATVKAWRDAKGQSIARPTKFYDRSGNGRDETGVSTQLIVDGNGFTYPRARYPQLRMALTTLGFAQAKAGITGITVAMLNSNISANQTIWAHSTNTASVARVSLKATATNFITSGRRLDGGTTKNVVGAAIDTGVAHVFGGRWDYPGNKQHTRVDATEVTGTPDTSGATTTNTASAGAALCACTVQGTNPSDSWIDECVLWDSYLSDAEYNAAFTALAQVRDNPAIAAAPLELYSAPQGKVYPVTNNANGTLASTGVVALNGAYSGTTTAIEYQLYRASDNALLTDWTNASATISAGLFSANLTIAAPALGVAYYRKIRKTDTPGVVYTETTTWTVGVVIGTSGQSNIQKDGCDRSGTPPTASTGVVRDMGGGFYPASNGAQTGEPTTNQGANGAGGDGLTTLGNAIAAALNMNVSVTPVAIVGTAQSTWKTGGSSWINAQAVWARAEIGSKFNGWIHYQGEADAVLGTAKATYKSEDLLIITQIRSLDANNANIPILLIPPSFDASATATNMDAIRQGILEICDAPPDALVLLGATTCDFSTVDGTHMNTANRPEANRRYAATMVKAFLGSGTDGTGGKITSITASAATQKIIATVTHNGGSALLDSSGSSAGTGLTPFRCLVAGVSKTISTTGFVGNTIEFTLPLATFIAGDAITLDNFFGIPTITNCVYDNNPFSGGTKPGRSLQPTRGTLSCTAGV
jgi:hypothetical protein